MFYCHGLPSSRLEAVLISKAAARLNLHVIAIDRPGYGRSDPQPPSPLCEWSDDLARVADLLGFDRFAVLGVSGGGPYALACGWRLADRVNRITLLCPLGPVALSHLRQPMSIAARWAFFLSASASRLLPLFYGRLTAALLRLHPTITFSLLKESLPAKDRLQLAQTEAREALHATIREGLRQGGLGPQRDFLLYTRDWGFELAEIKVTVDLWHGSADTVVPPSHSQYLADSIGNANLILIPGEGHYSLPIGHCEAILGRLAHKI